MCPPKHAISTDLVPYNNIFGKYDLLGGGILVYHFLPVRSWNIEYETVCYSECPFDVPCCLQEWVPIIRQDQISQRKIKAQPPLSDAYLLGMPAKRRKVNV